MNLADVMDELGDAADTITGLRVRRWPATGTPPVPCLIVAYPTVINFHTTYGSGVNRMTVPLALLVDKVSARGTRDKVAGWLSGSGPTSLKQAIEGHAYTACDVVTVTGVDVDVIREGTIDYLAATLSVDVLGPGSP